MNLAYKVLYQLYKEAYIELNNISVQNAYMSSRVVPNPNKFTSFINENFTYPYNGLLNPLPLHISLIPQLDEVLENNYYLRKKHLLENYIRCLSNLSKNWDDTVLASSRETSSLLFNAGFYPEDILLGGDTNEKLPPKKLEKFKEKNTNYELILKKIAFKKKFL